MRLSSSHLVASCVYWRRHEPPGFLQLTARVATSFLPARKEAAVIQPLSILSIHSLTRDPHLTNVMLELRGLASYDLERPAIDFDVQKYAAKTFLSYTLTGDEQTTITLRRIQ